MADLKTWNERLSKVDDKQLEKELKENLVRFNQIIFGLKKYKKGEENLRKLIEKDFKKNAGIAL